MQTPTPFPPAADPRSQQAPPPHWSTIAIAVLGILAATAGGIVGKGIVPAESKAGQVLVLVASIFSAAAVAIAQIWRQGKKEERVADGAAAIGLAEAQRNTTVTLAKPEDVDKIGGDL